MADLNDLSFEKFKLWSLNALRIYLSVRKKPITGNFHELVASLYDEEAKEQADREVQKAKADQERAEGELKEIKREKVHLLQEISNFKKIQEHQASENEELKAKLKDLETKVSAQTEKVYSRQIEEAKEQADREVQNANQERADGESKEIKREKVHIFQENSNFKKIQGQLASVNEELKAKLKDLETKISAQAEKLDTFIAGIRHLKDDKEDAELKLQVLQGEQGEQAASVQAMTAQQNNMENMKQTYEIKVSKYEKENTSLKQKLKETESEKDKILTRLFAMVKEKNPTFTDLKEKNPTYDLSDPNRPEKLGEQMSLLFDDQWTDATEALADLSMDDNAVVKTLLDVLIDIYEYCKEAAEEQLFRIEEDMFLPPTVGQVPITPDANGIDHQPKSPPPSKAHSALKENDVPDIFKSQKSKSMTFPRGKGEKVPDVPVDIKRGIKDYRKTVFKQVIPVIEKEITNKLRNKQDIGNDVVDKCKTYITRCVELCWLMCIQDPPCVLNWSFPEDRVFDTDVYRYYLTTGKQLDYVVWPAMHLFEGGPLIMKGVAEGKKV